MIKLESVTKRFANGHLAVQDLDLDVDRGQIAVLVGPSGCGKTTTMKMVNRLIEPTSGRILVDGKDVQQTDAVELRRTIGYVIQQVGLFPHQKVGANVATVPKLLGWDRRQTAARVDEMLDLVGLDPGSYRDRYPHQLSGGQQQRVGVARALCADPPVLLMDEPFGAIDPITRERLQDEFLRLQGELHKTVLFVTHDIEEAVKLGDRIAILREGGVLAQYDTPEEILANPASDFVADFVGSDRALKRLSVAGIDPDDLTHPPTVGAGATLADVSAAISSNGLGFALVLDDSGRALGSIDGDQASSGGTVADHLRPLQATVRSSATLKDALGALLLHDAPWVAVLGEGGGVIGVFTPESLHGASRRVADANGDGPESPATG